jgi:hypothetical protein
MMSPHLHAALAADPRELQRAGACCTPAAPERSSVVTLAHRQPRDALTADTCAALAMR